MENINSIIKIPEGSIFINSIIYPPINISKFNIIPPDSIFHNGKIYKKFENNYFEGKKKLIINYNYDKNDIIDKTDKIPSQNQNHLKKNKKNKIK